MDTRLPTVARLLAQGKTDWAAVKLIITRTDLVDGSLMPQLDQTMAERIGAWPCWSRQRVLNAVDAAVRLIDPGAAKERRVTADNARHVSLTAQPNGRARLHGGLPAPGAAVVDKRLTRWPPRCATVTAGQSFSVARMRCSHWPGAVHWPATAHTLIAQRGPTKTSLHRAARGW